MAAVESVMCISSNTDFDEIDCILKNLTGPTDSSLHGYDLLQQSIISGNDSALSYLVMKSYVPPTYHPSCNGYLHIACKLGRHSMVKRIIEARPDDFFHKGKACYPNPCYHIDVSGDDGEFSYTVGQLPIDIAIANKNIDCLFALLHHLPSDSQKRLCSAAFLCDLDHPPALQLYLKSGVADGDVKAAFRHALVKKRYACLDVLLATGYKDICDSGLNPFHVLYQYSSGYNRHASRHEGLTATTKVLLKHGGHAHISAHRPVGSYPLYGLIELIMKDVGAYGEEYVSEAISGNELLACLKLILKQGVDIYLDEFHLSHLATDNKENFAFGRNLYRSVFDIISANASTLLTVNLAASEVIRESMNILLASREHHFLQPSDLTGVMELMVKSRRSRSIEKNLEHVIHQYLWHGIDPSCPSLERRCFNSQNLTLYPLNQYIEFLCNSESDSGTSMAQTLSGNPIIKWLMNTMTSTSMHSANRVNMEILENSLQEPTKLTPPLVRFITSNPLLRLKTLAARVIWFSIDRRKQALQSLPLPNHIKSNILDIMIKEI